MDKVYCIFTGCYSDWDVVGFFTNLEEAENYCALKNSTIANDFAKYYVVEIDRINADLSKVDSRKYFNIIFGQKNGVFELYSIEMEKYIGTKKETKIRHRPSKGFAVSCDAEDKQQAIKIATDYLNEYKYLLCTTYIEEIENILDMERV